MRLPSSLGRTLAPSAVATVLAATIGGLVEAVPATSSVPDALAATGFITMVMIPLGLVVSVVLRALVAAWRPAALIAELTESDGSAPRLAAWLVAVATFVASLGVIVFYGLAVTMARTQAAMVHLVVAPLLAVVGAVVLLALARPALVLLAAGFERLERRARARGGRSRLRPRRIFAGFGVALAIGGWLAWSLVLAPRIGDLDLGFLGAALAWAIVLVATPPLVRSAFNDPRRALVLGSLTFVAAVLPLAVATWTRTARPTTMLQLWGETRLAGLAIDLLYDIEGLRGDMTLEDIAPPARPGAPHPDVVLVTIDTVRGDMTPLNGGTVPMPALASLAGHAAVFDWAFSPGNVTRRSLPAIATGRSPTRVRGRVTGWALKLDPRHVMLAERFAAAGYDTAGFFCCDSHFGRRHHLGLDRGIQHLEIAYGGDELAARLAAYLAARRSDKPLFVWLHFIEPHNWERDQVATASSRTLRDRYGLSLTAVDRHLGAVLETVWTPARRANTILAVTADHGESLGDHRSRTHAKTLFNSEVRVPLAIAAPGVAPRRVLRPVGLIDLAPTLLELAGFAPPGMPEMDGVSLTPVLRGEHAALEDGSAYSVQLVDRSVASGFSAVVVGRHKLIVDEQGKTVGLYDFVADRGEKNDLSRKAPATRARLEAELRRRQAIDRVALPGR